jgi:hypothetical protein
MRKLAHEKREKQRRGQLMLERINQRLESELEIRQKENEYKRALEEMEKERRRVEIENKVYQRIQDRNDCKEIMIERTR